MISAAHRQIAALAACIVIWSTTWAVIRVGLDAIPPFKGAAIRFAIAGALLLAVALIRRVPLGRTSRERWLWLSNGTLNFAGSYGIVYWAEQWVPSGLTAIIFSSYPLFLALVAHIMLPGERLTPRSGAGVLVGFAGIAIIFSEDFALLGGPGVARGALVMLGSPIACAFASAAVKRWGEDVPPLSLTSVPMLICAAILGVLALLLEGARPITWNGAAVGSLLYLSLAGSAVTFMLFFWLLQRMKATRVGLIAYIVPVMALLVGILFMGEPATLRTYLGAVVVVLGVVTASRARLPEK